MIRKRNDLASLCIEHGLTKGVEVGVFDGGFSKILNDAYQYEEFVCVDPWEGNESQYRNVKNLFSNRPTITILRTTSVKASTLFADGYFDFVYIDALHDFDSVVEDLTVWYPKLRKGGLFSGHDYNDRGGKRGKKAVDFFFKDKSEDVLSTTMESCASWYLFKD
jgi:predicted O-methyltransferase YrrM